MSFSYKDEDEMIKVDIEELKFLLSNEIENSDADNNEFEPFALDRCTAIREGIAMLNDFKHEKDSTVVNVFSYKQGYQVDIISSHPEYEIYRDLYDGEDVVLQMMWGGDEIKKVDMV